MSLTKKLGAGTGICLFFLAIISFYYFSPVTSPFYHSDHAVHVLMAYDLHLPEGFYFRGQDRLGSVLPILAFALRKLTGLPPIWAVAIMNYIILIIGGFLFSLLFKNFLQRAIFLLIWFFPPRAFFEFVYPSHPDNIQLTILAACLLLFMRFPEMEERRFIKYNIGIQLMVALACYVSETSVVFIPAYLLTVAYYLKINRYKLMVWFSTMLSFCIIFLIAFLFIKYAKSHAYHIPLYLERNSVSEALSMLTAIWEEFWGILTDGPLAERIAYGFLILGFFIGIIKVLIIKPAFRGKLLLLIAVLLFIVPLFSKWVMINYHGSRYFILPFYLSCIFSILYLPEEKFHPLYLVWIVISVASFISAVQPYHSSKIELISTPKKFMEFKTDEPIGIIGSYWFSYNIGSIAPDKIKASPHDKEHVRIPEITEEVLKMKNVIIIGDRWLKTFPDTLYQFGKQFIRNGEPSEKAGLQTCWYIQTGIKQ